LDNYGSGFRYYRFRRSIPIWSEQVMADGKTFEYGSSAAEVQFQDEIGKIKNRQGEAVIEVNDEQEFFLATSGDSVKIKTLIDDDAFGVTATDTALATAESIKAYVDASSGGGGSSTFTDVTVDTNTLVANITGYTDKVGIGTATPRSTLDILDASNPQLRVSQADDSVYADVQAKSTGGVHITPTGGTYAGHTFLKSGSSSSYLVVQNVTTGNTDDRTKGLTVGAGSNIAYLWMRSSTGSAGQLKIGVDGANAITIDASNNTTAVNNLSANGNVTLGDAGADAHTLNGSLQFASEIVAPSAPGAGAGGIFYVKSDGIPYYSSNSTAETSLVGGGGGGTTTTGTTLVTADPAPAVADTMYLCDATSAFNVTLPTALAAGNGGEINVCKAAGANNVTVLRASSDTINGSTSVVVSTLYANVTLVSDGTSKWYIK
jgi:hypothetical protein